MNVFVAEKVLGGAGIAAAYHRFQPGKLVLCNQAESATAGAGQYGDEGISRLAHTSHIFQKKQGSGLHLFGDPLFKQL